MTATTTDIRGYVDDIYTRQHYGNLHSTLYHRLERNEMTNYLGYQTEDGDMKLVEIKKRSFLRKKSGL